VRLTPAGPVVVLPRHGLDANVSPDGRHIAYLAGSAADYHTGTDVIVVDADGRNLRTVMHGATDQGYEPTWSPNGTRLLVGRPSADGNGTPGVVDVATGRFTALAHNPAGIHYLWSADGRHLGYATGMCQVGLADPDGGNAHLVPVLGSLDRKCNPDLRRGCHTRSIAPDGGRMAILQHTGDKPDGDIARTLTANTVIDTRTGAVVRLPVTGDVKTVLFQPDGSMLVRTEGHLTLVSAAGTVIASVTEPSTVDRLGLVAYVPSVTSLER